uniref:Latent-transforming growth factor beta-binding protein 1 n=1 Tax=Amphiprion ocellaris TaxID=80972 RepID=A0AAQ5YXM0_AMPOC
MVVFCNLVSLCGCRRSFLSFCGCLVSISGDFVHLLVVVLIVLCLFVVVLVVLHVFVCILVLLCVERIQVMFTPTICKVRCSQDRCVNYCERGNVTTLYSSAEGGGRRDGAHGPGFRVFLCPLLCQNGGVCLQKDRCLCPPNFTGKFCQIPVSSSSTNEIVRPAGLAAMATNQELTRSEFLLPLGQNREETRSEALGPSMVKVRVQHPPEANVKIHQVLKVSGFSPTLQTSSSSSSGSAGAPAPAASGVQAQTVRGDGVYTQQSGFKYCFREVKDGQCSSPLPGLRSREMCCRGIGKAWGITDCVLCPENTGQSNSSCNLGYERVNGTQCVDVNECLQPGLCENGFCVNTRGSYSCVCRPGFILDASHGLCISHSVISEEKGQCYRVLGSGLGPGSCSLPILRNITKQICCCSRVGKAWGTNCQRCPYFGSVAFKEICPAGPGYHYSASALQFNQRVTEQLGSRGASLVPNSNQGNQNNRGNYDNQNNQGNCDNQNNQGNQNNQINWNNHSGGRTSSGSRPDQPTPKGDSLPAPSQPRSPDRGSRPSVCESRPGVCGRGRCVDQPGGKHTCVCDQGFQLNAQRTNCQDVNECVQTAGVCSVGKCVNSAGSFRCVCPSGYKNNNQQNDCQDIDECQQNPCSNGRCDNTPGSYRCVCRLGYRLTGNTCTDVDECVDPVQCPGQECINSQGSYRCVSCQPGFGLLNRICTGKTHLLYVPRILSTMFTNDDKMLKNSLKIYIDECRQAPCSNGRCENTPGSYRCVCRHGYKLQNNTCTDVDECSEPSQCPGQMCVNSVGSYRCVSCRPGYTLTNRQCTVSVLLMFSVNRNNLTEALLSADVNECEAGDACPGRRCVNSEGSYRCVDCQQGFRAVNGDCSGSLNIPTILEYIPFICCCISKSDLHVVDVSAADVDECLKVGVCDAERVCVNTVGSFRCDCQPGYRTSGLGRQCRDINECLEGDFCFSRGECVNTPGSFTCVCSRGFTLSDNRTACLDVDECLKSGICSDGRCLNTEGSFQCQCETGFTANPEKNACLDVDECVSSGGSVCGSQRCENTIGSYRCLTSCEPGYQATLGGGCVDVNECGNTTVCGEHAFCQNLIGTYLCVCDQGFTSTVDGKACEDEDECVSLPGVCGSARCENMEGSFMCECDRAGEEFDTTTKRCLSPMLPPLPAARPGELRECYYNLAERGTCSLLATNTSQQECCCTVGEGWGLGCQLVCVAAEFLSLCPSGRGYITAGPGAFSYTDVDECKRFLPEVCKNGVCVNNIPGYSCYCSSGYVYNSTLLECIDHDECEEESCVGGICVNTVGSYYCSCQHPLVLDDTQRNCVNSSHLTVDENLSVCWQQVTADLLCQNPLLGAQVTFMDCCCLYGEGWGMGCALCPSSDSGKQQTNKQKNTTSITGYYPEGDYGPPDGSRPPSFRLPPDPRAEISFGAQPPPPSRPDAPPLSLAPLPGAPRYEEEEEEEEEERSWRPGPPFPPFTDRSRGGAAPRRLYERRYESYASLSAAEDCGILHGCENGRCIRVAEGYTCDCYQGYELDMTSMTCIDINECEDAVGLEFPCVNARCVNTDGSFRCVCRRGYVMSRRPNHCVAA